MSGASSSLPRPAPAPAPAPAGGTPQGLQVPAASPNPERIGPLGAFTREALPPFEAALARAVSPAPGLTPVVGSALRSAVGADGVPGSRWRPLLTLAAARAAGASLEVAMPAAVAVELTHTASLVLDDLPCMDDAGERRGVPSTHRQVGSGGAILLALSLLGKAAELLGSLPGEGGSLVASWGEAIGMGGMSGGQAVDLTGAFMAGGAPRRLHRKKTTSLSSLALEAGARCAGAPEATRSSLVRFGRDLGWAYQLADDEQDWKEDARLGKGAGGRSPRRQSERLLGRAIRHLEEAPGLEDEGRLLLELLARRAAGFPMAGEARQWG